MRKACFLMAHMSNRYRANLPIANTHYLLPITKNPPFTHCIHRFGVFSALTNYLTHSGCHIERFLHENFINWMTQTGNIIGLRKRMAACVCARCVWTWFIGGTRKWMIWLHSWGHFIFLLDIIFTRIERFPSCDCSAQTWGGAYNPVYGLFLSSSSPKRNM